MSDPQPTDPTPPADVDPEGTPPATPPADPAQDTDWKAEARKWERRAKENSTAAEQLEKHKASAMSDAEKAVAAAKVEGASEAAKAYGLKLAKAELKAAAAAKGVDLADFDDLIDVSKFLTDKGEVDDDAIKKAVARFAKLAAPKAGRSGGEMPGAPGGTEPITEAQLAKMTPEQIAKAYEAGQLKHLM